MELDEVREELYGLRPPEFTAVRNERARRARSDGHRQLAERISGLRRPTLAAWASNLLVRDRREVVEPLLRLGRELRAAHRDRDGGRLRELSRQQWQLVNVLAEQAGQLASAAGHPLGGQPRQELEQTLRAVLADPDVAEEWAEGRLSKPPAVPVGFDAAAREISAVPGDRGAAARRRTKTPRKAAAKSGRAGEHPSRRNKQETEERTRRDSRQAADEARRNSRQAADEARRARRRAETAQRDAAATRADCRETDELLGRLRGELRRAEEHRSGLRKRERQADQAERAARRAAEDAEARAQRQAGGAAPAGPSPRHATAGKRKR